jgi:release factor glutamine methyltransferase
VTITAGEALRKAAGLLAGSGVDSPKLDARLLLAEVMGWPSQALEARPELELSDEQAARFDSLILRRAQREPVCQILEQRGFWTLDLRVTGDTLAPRPDTETLVDAVLEGVRDKKYPLRILDLGTGSGCLLLALLSEFPNATGIGVDISEKALAVARHNARASGLEARAEFIKSDWGRALGDGLFDIVVSNPPYIADAEIETLEPEVAQWEPRLALSGGEDGFDCYRAIIPELPRLMCDDGFAFLEVGMGQSPKVVAMADEAGLLVKGVRRDLGGIERCVIAGKVN